MEEPDRGATTSPSNEILGYKLPASPYLAKGILGTCSLCEAADRSQAEMHVGHTAARLFNLFKGVVFLENCRAGIRWPQTNGKTLSGLKYKGCMPVSRSTVSDQNRLPSSVLFEARMRHKGMTHFAGASPNNTIASRRFHQYRDFVAATLKPTLPIDDSSGCLLDLKVARSLCS